MGDTYQSVVNNLNTMFTELYAGVKNGGGTNVRPAGNIFVQPGTIGSSATTTSQTLVTFPLPGGSLANTNSEVIATAWGRCGATGTPFIVMNMGGANGSVAAGSHANSHWLIEGIMTKPSANNQNDVFFVSSGAITAVKSSSDTSTDASAITISVVASDANAVQSSVLLDGMTVEFFS